MTTKPTVEKLRWLMTAFCLLAMFSVFVVSVGGHVRTENKEVVEFEEFEALTTRRISSHRIDRDKNSSEFAVIDQKLKPEFSVLVLRRARTERDRFNGIGTYLLT